METIAELTKVDFSSVFISVFVILIGLKAIISLFDWIIELLGLETKWMRRQREEHELLVKTSQNIRQFDSLMLANRELLAEKINEKYKYYISVNGIPEDEVDEFTNLHIAYKGCGGNHSGDAKYEYVMEHLPVIPVETKLVFRHDISEIDIK